MVGVLETIGQACNRVDSLGSVNMCGLAEAKVCNLVMHPNTSAVQLVA